MPHLDLALSALGYGGRWPALLADLSDDGLHGRVVRADRGAATILTTAGLRRATWLPTAPPPVTGDWVVLNGDPSPGETTHALIGIATRATAMTRPSPANSPHGDQVLAANVDLVGVVVPVDDEVRVRRLERGIVMAYESGATPVVIVTKVDIAVDLDMALTTISSAAVGVDVVQVSPVTGHGLDQVADLLTPDRTMVLLGASGAGKSTIANALAGEEVLATGAVREVDGKGRHTTSHRELIALPGGGAILDTPGLRTLSVGMAEDGLALAFPDVDELTVTCRFGDCRHETEPGCGVIAALEAGDLDPDRFEGWLRIRAETENAALRADTAAYRKVAKSWGRIYREAQAVKNRD